MPAHYGSGKGKPKPIGGRKPLAGKPAAGGATGSKKPGKKPIKNGPLKPQPVGGMGGNKPKPIKKRGR